MQEIGHSFVNLWHLPVLGQMLRKIFEVQRLFIRLPQRIRIHTQVVVPYSVNYWDKAL